MKEWQKKLSNMWQPSILSSWTCYLFLFPHLMLLVPHVDSATNFIRQDYYIAEGSMLNSTLTSHPETPT